MAIPVAVETFGVAICHITRRGISAWCGSFHSWPITRSLTVAFREHHRRLLKRNESFTYDLVAHLLQALCCHGITKRVIIRRQSLNESKDFHLFVELQSTCFQSPEVILMLCYDRRHTRFDVIAFVEYYFEAALVKRWCDPRTPLLTFSTFRMWDLQC